MEENACRCGHFALLDEENAVAPLKNSGDLAV
jgi:hypothetical protein